MLAATIRPRQDALVACWQGYFFLRVYGPRHP